MITRASFAAAICCAFSFQQASADVFLGFESLSHGEIVSGQFQLSDGVTISAINERQPGLDLVIAFDSHLGGTADPDLEDPWSGGNLPSTTFLGKLLILAENDTDHDGDGLIDSPDDEGGQPAGSITFAFDQLMTSFGFDLIDIENATEPDAGYVALFLDDHLVKKVGFLDLAGAIFGNNSANRIPPIFAPLGFNKATIRLGGSGAIDNVTAQTIQLQQHHVPEPASMAVWLLLIAVGGLFVYRHAMPHRVVDHEPAR